MQAREHGTNAPPVRPRELRRDWRWPLAAALACAAAVLLATWVPDLLTLALIGGPLAVAALLHRARTAPTGSVHATPAGARLMIKTVVPVWQRQLECARTEADRELGRLLQQFVILSEALEHAPADSGAPVLDLAPVYVGLQFQDRLGQMLESVSRDMARFTDVLAEHDLADPAAASRWLERLERSYTMDEQRHQHAGPPASARGSAPATSTVAAPASQGVEFF